MSVDGSVNTSLAVNSRPSDVRIVTVPPPATTWLFVNTMPSLSMITPLPLPPPGRGIPGIIRGPPRRPGFIRGPNGDWPPNPPFPNGEPGPKKSSNGVPLNGLLGSWAGRFEPGTFGVAGTGVVAVRFGRFSIETTAGSTARLTVRNANDRSFASATASWTSAGISASGDLPAVRPSTSVEPATKPTPDASATLANVETGAMRFISSNSFQRCEKVSTDL